MFQEIGNISQLDNKIKSLQSKKNKKTSLITKICFTNLRKFIASQLDNIIYLKDHYKPACIYIIKFKEKLIYCTTQLDKKKKKLKMLMKRLRNQ